MTRLTLRGSVFGLFVLLNVAVSLKTNVANEKNGILECFHADNSLACAKKRVDAELDAIETEVSGVKSSIALSKVLEEAGEIMIDGTRSLFGQSDETTTEDIEDSDDNGKVQGRSDLRQARKKFGKKKKKMLQKFLAFAMVLKSKISLILQLISTHLQIKFFVIAVISLIINVAHFWFDIKKKHHPEKVIYYEHAQHQHHYDHEDDQGGYWGRSDEDWPAQELAYSADQSRN